MNPSHGPKFSVESIVVVPPLDAFMILRSSGLGCSAKSGKHDTRTFSYFHHKGITQQQHLFLFASLCWKRNENRQKVCQWCSFYLSLCVAFVSCCVIARCCCVCYFYGYFFVVWRRFVVIDLLWTLKRFGTCSSRIVSLHIEALAIGGSCSQIVIISTNFVLFCCVWCFISWMLWVHLCNFNATTMFLFMAIFMGFVFSLH